jgi:carboxyl-terminal processing protease
MLACAVLDRLAGAVGDSVDIHFLDEKDQSTLLRIPFVKARGETCRLGHFPPFSVWIEAKPLDQDIGYIAFNAFLNPIRLMPVYNQAMMSFMNAKGLVIDLRGNLGGMGDMVMGMAGWLVSTKNQYLGSSKTRDAELRFILFPRPVTYAGPVAVLVDGLSVCGSEIMAQGLRDIGRARLFGTRTYGAAMASVFERLPNGDGFQYAFADYTSRNGEVLEKKGLRPDVEVQITREAILAGKDPVLEAAVQWIHHLETNR